MNLEERIRRSPLLQKVRSAARTRHLSRRTEDAYLRWIVRFILFHGRRHPNELDESHVNAFLTDLAVRRKVSVSTQSQALCAILFLYRVVLGRELGLLGEIPRPKRRRRAPVVLTADEVARVLDHMSGVERLVATLIYGTGMRISEALALRVKDLDLAEHQITVRDAKGGRDRFTVLPATLIPALERHLAETRALHRRDVRDGFGVVPLPSALARKYPGAGRTWSWQWVFPAPRRRRDPSTGREWRPHLNERQIQRAFRAAVGCADIAKPATPHTLRHSFATHLLLSYVDIKTVQELLGHGSVKTTMIYLHRLQASGRAVTSPADLLRAPTGPSPADGTPTRQTTTHL